MEDIIIKRIEQIQIVVVDQNEHSHSIRIKDLIKAKNGELSLNGTDESDEREIQISLKCEGYSISIDEDNN